MSKKGPKIANDVNPACTFVELSTWGTHYGGGNGMAHYLDSEFFGGNVGHAALQITFPADDAGEELIRKYCRRDDNTVIPFEKISMKIMKDNKVTTQEVYKVNFSWWPGKDDKKYSLKDNNNVDGINERLGVNVGPRAPRFEDPGEQRIGRGELGSRVNHLGPSQITHMKISSEKDENQLLEAKQKNIPIQTEIDALEVILKKLGGPEDEKPVHTAGTLLMLLNKHEPNWKNLISLNGDSATPKLFNQEQKNILRNAIKEKLDGKNNEKNKNINIINALNANFEMREEKKLLGEIESLEKELNNIDSNDLNKEEKTLQVRNKLSSSTWNLYQLKKVTDERDMMQPLRQFFSRNYELTEDKDMILSVLFDGKAENNTELDEINGKIEKNKKSLELAEKNLSLSKTDQEKKEISKSIKSLKTVNNILIVRAREISEKSNKDASDIQKIFLELLHSAHPGITRETMTKEIYKDVINKQKQKYKELVERQIELTREVAITKLTDPFFAGGYERNITQGSPPDNKITLPVSNIPSKGLNIENMLIKMREITDDGVEFNLTTKNCSATTGAILAAGAGPELGSYMKQKAWGGFGNPQEVLNGAMQYQSTILHNHGKKPLSEKIAAYNPLNAVTYVGGKVLSNYMDPNVTKATKIGLVVALPLVAVAAGIVQTAKALANPLKSLNNSSKFINYAWENNSAALKVLSVPVALAATVISPLAGVQYGIKKAIVDPIRKNAEAKKTKSILANNPDKAVVSDPNVKVHIDNQAKNVQKINGNTASDLINQMNNILNEGKLPELSPSAREIMNSEMNREDRVKLHEMQQKIQAKIYPETLTAFNRTKGSDEKIVLIDAEEPKPRSPRNSKS